MPFDPESSILFRAVSSGLNYIYHTGQGIAYQSGVEVTNRSGATGQGIGFIGARTAATVSGTIQVHDDAASVGGPVGNEVDQSQLTKEAQARNLRNLEGQLIVVEHLSITNAKGNVVGTMESVTVKPSDQHMNVMEVSFTVKELLGVNEDGSVSGVGTEPFFVPISRIVPPSSTDPLGPEAPGSGTKKKKCTPAKKSTTDAINWVSKNVKRHPGLALTAVSPVIGSHYFLAKTSYGFIKKAAPHIKSAAQAVKAGYDGATELQKYGATMVVGPLGPIAKVLKDAYFDKTEMCSS